MKNRKDEYRHWKTEKKWIPVMIRMYCHGKHRTKKLCPECRKLTEYALFRLEKCPFKKNKTFCSYCKVHCYRPKEREQIREVMRFAGPRMLFVHPIFAIKHGIELIRYKRRKRNAR